MKYLFIFLTCCLLAEDGPWTFKNNRGEEIALEWSSSSALESVRSIYLEAYLDGDLYRAFLPAETREEAMAQLNAAWDFRKGVYQKKLESSPPEAYFAVAKKNFKFLGFVIFHQEGPDEVSISPISILPEMQKTGLGKELVFSILRLFPNIKKISLRTTKDMPATEFYRYLGFEEVKNEVKRNQIEDPKLRENALFFEWSSSEQ